VSSLLEGSILSDPSYKVAAAKHGAPKSFRKLYNKARMLERHELQYIATAAAGVVVKFPLFK